MLLTKIALTNYKNFSALEVTPHPGLNLLIAPNGSGKTNLLEAINYLAEGSSFRGVGDEFVFPYADTSADIVAITAQLEENGINTQLRLVWEKQSPANAGGKTYLLNHKKSNIQGFRRHLLTVVHAPTSLDVVAGPGKLRRDFLDNTNLKLRGDLRDNLQTYARVLRQKNRLLKLYQAGKISHSDTVIQIPLWEEKLYTHGAMITLARISLLKTLSPVLGEIAAEIYHLDRYDLEFSLTSKYFSLEELASFDTRADQVDYLAAQLRQKLESNREKELRAGKSLYGTHLDDYEFLLNGQSVRYAASRGQQRLFSLILHLATLRMLQAETGRRFLLLLDDIFSELDEEHRLKTLNYLKVMIKENILEQVIITSPDARDLPKKMRKATELIIIA